ncbi:rhodanese-like domain-containing protein 6 isoform X2 [Magnolia sinica]|uniref:rhodanese-like domain-containing protein 6 isoform X2 n=1 Tax=Magnolia sinica TaxID=86752 RepID=UPI00265997D2|nr:rhodanese-like domain-containing protein 6 isoform X2 [Magnolia sinica]
MATREEEEGVLLYYKYVSIPDVSELLRFYKSNCDSLHLLGRVRLAPDGVNVTVGGKLSALEKHILTIKSNSLFEGTDFKLASCHSPSNDRVAQECGFTSLSIRVVKELVTFSSQPLLKSPSISNAGKHLSANEFHSVLQNAGNALDSTQDKRLVLLDARNVYETRIGKFHTPNAETLDPKIRQYSDLPAWIDNHSKQLQGSCVLMYCTGGIRCEMASAYIRSKGVGFENVFQLFGGIQRYLEQFPDGGFFKGKNFVFDHRIAVGSSNADVLGSCLVCGSSFDDYSSRCRCTYCRMLVLVCDGCQGEGSATYICELCQKHGKGDGPVLMMENENFNSRSKCGGSEVLELESATLSDHSTSFPELPLRDGGMPPRKLRILCLHGFRQNASNFKGRTASLAKKLKNIAEFVYVDAPHELPFIYQPRPTKPNHGSEESPSPRQMNDVNKASQDHPPSLENCKKRFAWLVAPKFDCPGEMDWKAADKPFDPLQYQHQTDGFEESYDYLKTVYSQMGPFDGVLGFSQGAAMAALLCAQRGRDDSALCFRFAILCSGFQIFSENVVWGSSINCPSLHIFGGGERKDRQIACSVSMELTHLFDEGSSVVMEHESGHIIPTQSPYIDRIKDFLQRFC